MQIRSLFPLLAKSFDRYQDSGEGPEGKGQPETSLKVENMSSLLGKTKKKNSESDYKGMTGVFVTL